MNTDHDFQIGKDHVVCQDYALSGIEGDYAYAIVCDGCSASPDTDFGARLLALSAREVLLREPHLFWDDSTFRNTVIRKAAHACSSFRCLHPQILDTTLLVSFIHGDQLKVRMYGDGIFYHKKANGAVHITHVSYETLENGVIKTAPDYLAYYLDNYRMGKYEATNTTKFIETNGCITTMNPFQPVFYASKVEQGDIIGLASDGVGSFRTATNDPIPWEQISKEFFDFKQTKGVFVRRRLQAFKRNCLKDNVTHYDDISVAAIVI
jgi:hypothetical protein